MAEQTINYGYGEAMFKNVDPKAVVLGVGKAAKGWWDDFSPGTMGVKELQAFENVVSRVKNEDLRALLEHKNMKTFVRGVGTVVGVQALECDVVAATIPWIMKLRGYRETDYPAFVTKAEQESPSRILEQEYRRIENSQVGQKTKKAAASWVDSNLTSKERLKDFFRGSPLHRANVKSEAARADSWIREKADESIADRSGLRPKFTARGAQLLEEDVRKRLQGYKEGVAAKLVGIAGAEAVLFHFRPVTRLAKLRIKATEAVGSWVVDNIVNNIVKGPSIV